VFTVFSGVRGVSDNEGQMMTATQAAELRVKWKQRVKPSPCEHLNLELERSDNGYLTGNYTCIVCGEVAAQKQT
jgi:hypothetical protein